MKTVDRNDGIKSGTITYIFYTRYISGCLIKKYEKANGLKSNNISTLCAPLPYWRCVKIKINILVFFGKRCIGRYLTSRLLHTVTYIRTYILVLFGIKYIYVPVHLLYCISLTINQATGYHRILILVISVYDPVEMKEYWIPDSITVHQSNNLVSYLMQNFLLSVLCWIFICTVHT